MNATTRPRRITHSATLQLVVAALYLLVPAVGLLYGSDVQAAAEAAFADQGVSAKILADNGISFAETGGAIAIPVIVTAVLVTAAALLRAGKRAGRVLALIFLPVLLLLEAYIVYSQLYAAELVGAALAATGSAELTGVDAAPILAAADAAYPGWLSIAVVVRHVAVPLGALLAFVLLLGGRAKAHFRKTA